MQTHVTPTVIIKTTISNGNGFRKAKLEQVGRLEAANEDWKG